MKPMTSARATMRSTQLEEKVSISVIQYIPACHTHTHKYIFRVITSVVMSLLQTQTGSAVPV